MIPRRVYVGTFLFIAAGLVAGCYESAFPLDPAPQLAVDPALVGRWRCITPDQSDDGVTVTVDRSGDRTYAVAVQEAKNTPDRYEGYLSSVNGTTLANLRNLEGGKKPWTFLHVSVLRPNVLFVQWLDKALFKGVAETPQAVRAVIARERRNPALLQDVCVCVRMEPENK